MNVNEDYNRILENNIKSELEWLEEELNYLFDGKKTLSDKDILMGNQILNNVIDSIDINNSKELLNLLTLTLDKIEQTFPEFF